VVPASELAPQPQLASLKTDEPAMLPLGVVFSIEDPAADNAEATAQGIAPLAAPAKLPLPPASLGPLPLREAAAKGDAQAQYAIAIRYADAKSTKRDLKEAANWFKRAASAGLAPAQYRLAAMFERGLGVDKDIGRARSWYAAAAEKGNIKAMHNLAVSVSGRDGGEADYALAAKWYGEAAAYGLADSQFNLGILAEHGLGRKKSLTDAYKWFALAAANGDTEAAKRREVIRVQLAPSTLAEAEAEVKMWKAKDAPAEANEVAEPETWASAEPITPNASLVSRAQTLLNKLGYDVGPPDGLVGDRTRTAIKLFERRNGLEETGDISIPLVTRLERLTS
jgi:localization factor PodJL